MSTLEKQSKAAMDQLADNKGYNPGELISIKTTLHLPYYTGSASYERAYGSIEVSGVTYQYVMRRVYQDTLELLCLPNGDVQKIKEAKNSIAGQSADAGSTAPHKTVVKVLLPDLFHHSATQYMLPISPVKNVYGPGQPVITTSGHLSQPDQPPRLLQCA
ncbi:MAG TPA: hypothetical protein VGB56_02360 [Flavisolibacter sp.]|jgi:hypothetical protein